MAIDGRIGVVTVTYNSAGVVEDFLRSLADQQYEAFVLYVVDNASQDDTREITIRQFGSDPRCVVIANAQNLGVAAGNNIGIRRAIEDGCSHVLLLNNDTVFGNKLLGDLLGALRLLGAHAVVPKIMFFQPDNRIWCAGGGLNKWRAFSPVHFGEGEIDNGLHDTALAINYAPTCCMLITKEVFEEVGLMDENYFVYYDDLDFVFQMIKAGHGLWYVPKAMLKHKVSSLTGGGLSDFSILHGTRGKVYFIRKNMRRTTSWLWLALYFLVLTSRLFVPGYGPAKAKIMFRGVLQGMRLRVRNGLRHL